MKTLFEYIWKLEMILIGLAAIGCYGRYNYYKGRISKTRERGDNVEVVVNLIEET